jgi:hypothetical protein
MNALAAVPWATVGLVLGAALAVTLIVVVFKIARDRGVR